MAGFFSGYSNAPNVLTGGLTDQPDWTPTQLDPYTTALINQENAQGNQSLDQIKQQELNGTSATMPSATGGAVGQQQASLGGSGVDAATATALNDRANRLYSSQYNQLENQATASAPGRQAQLVNQAAGGLQSQQNVNDALNQMQMQVTAQKNAMRNQIIGQVLSGAGSFAGTYAGMKPTNQLDTSTQTMMNQMNGTPGPQTPELGSGLNGTAPNLGVPMNNFGSPGQDGNGYYGEPPPGNNQGYGLGVSYQGLG